MRNTFYILILLACNLAYGNSILIQSGYSPKVAAQIEKYRPDILRLSGKSHLEKPLNYPADFQNWATSPSSSTEPISVYRGICFFTLDDYNPRFNNFSISGSPSKSIMYVAGPSNKDLSEKFAVNCRRQGSYDFFAAFFEFQIPRFALFGDESGGAVVRDFIPDDRPFLVSVKLTKAHRNEDGTFIMGTPSIFSLDDLLPLISDKYPTLSTEDFLFPSTK